MAGPLIVRRFGLDRLQANNEVAGFKFATVGVLYAVLLAFAVIVVWEKFNEAENDVALEAGAAATVYRLSDGFGGSRCATRDARPPYLEAAIEEDWPAMARGPRRRPKPALNALYAAVLVRAGPRADGRSLLSECSTSSTTHPGAAGAHRDGRGHHAGNHLAGAFRRRVVTIGFTFFFGTENLRAQALMTGGLTLLIFAGLLIIVAIDRPFAGTVTSAPSPRAGARGLRRSAVAGGGELDVEEARVERRCRS